MKRGQSTYDGINELKSEYATRKDAIRSRLADFAAVKPDEYFYELVYCLLTPQSSAVSAGKAVEALKAADLFGSGISPASLLHQKAYYIRFHNTKARNLKDGRERFSEIAAKLSGPSTSLEIREWLVANVRGLGWKEASHFLRNIGHRNLAILDRHILRNLKKHGVLMRLPATLTPRRYRSIEEAFARFALDIGIPMDELDLLFWSRETGQILK